VTSLVVNGADLGPVNCWNTVGAALSLNATDGSASSGISRIGYSLAGAQTGSGQSAGANATVSVSAVGTTVLTYSAMDLADNEEAAKTVGVFVAQGLPLTCAAASIPSAVPPHGTLTVVGTITVSVSGVTRTRPFNVTFKY